VIKINQWALVNVLNKTLEILIDFIKNNKTTLVQFPIMQHKH